MKQHLLEHCLKSAEHHVTMAKAHAAMASCHHELAQKAHTHDYHKDLGDAHDAASAAHTAHAEHYIGLHKSLETAVDTLPSPARETNTHGSEFGGRDFREAMLGDLSKIVPDGVARVVPPDPLEGLRMVPRPGAPTPVDLSKVDPALQDLVKVD